MNNDLKNKDSSGNLIKFGTFQLQTKSFWFGIVGILTMFLFGMSWLNIYYSNKIILEVLELSKKIVEINIK